ncbi:gamma-secretase-activating protein [Anaeramoeba ignava]|uniref:Gamma-secretase-activating protein n=1 Tax=Anaeramoeba ignava TaxID=1746090 RepID=A0A9Q0RGW6_ANAIG|nr:gamma-secretase-activating protein [Anaeramoeba ignava]
MIRVNRLFSLSDNLEEVVPEIPKDSLDKIKQNKNKNKNKEEKAKKNIFPSQKIHQISGNIVKHLIVVGQENKHQKNSQTQILVSRDCYDKDLKMKTSIDLYNISFYIRKCIYQHSEKIYCVGASLNHNETLLAFTKFFTIREENEDISYYQTFIVELKNDNNLKEIGNKSQIFQKAIFLKNDFSSNHDSLLFIQDKFQIEVIKISLANKKKLHKKIISKISQSYLVCKNFLWYEFDSVARNLFYIKKRSGSEYILTCVSFNSKNSQILLEYPIKIDHLGQESNQNIYTHHIYTHGYTSPDSNLNFEIIQLSHSAFCLCQQIIMFPTHNVPFILVIIWVLHRQEKLEIEIPLSGISQEKLKDIRVFFGSVCELLLIYIPGKFIQFVDCAKIHETCDSLRFFGNENATPLGDSNNEDDNECIPNISKIVFLAHDSTETLKKQGNCLIDNKNETAFRYRIDTNGIYHIFTSPKMMKFSIPTLHILVMHMMEPFRVNHLIYHLSGNFPQALTPEFFQEYLIGNTYLNFRNYKFESNLREFANNLIQAFPVTSILSYQSIVKKLKKGIQTSHDLNIRKIQIQESTNSKIGFKPCKRFSYLKFRKIPYIALVNEFEDTPNKKKKEGDDLFDQFIEDKNYFWPGHQILNQRKMIARIISDHIMQYFPIRTRNQKIFVIKLINIFLNCMNDSVNSLFSVLKSVLLSVQIQGKNYEITNIKSWKNLQSLSMENEIKQPSRKIIKKVILEQRNEFAKKYIVKPIPKRNAKKNSSKNKTQVDKSNAENSLDDDFVNINEQNSFDSTFTTTTDDNQNQQEKSTKDLEHNFTLEKYQQNAFYVLRNLYIAIQELYYPFPENFHYHFCRLGILSQDRLQFLNSLKQDMFLLDEEFIDDVLKNLGDLDIDLKIQLLSSLENEENFLKKAKQEPQFLKNVVEIVSSRVADIFDFDSEKNIKYQRNEKQGGLPLNLWCEEISEENKSKFKNEIELIESNSSLFVSQNLNQNSNLNSNLNSNQI